MKILIVLLFSTIFLGAAEPVLSKRGKLIFEDSFSKKLNSAWKFNKGKWQVKGGRLIGEEPQGNNHAVHLAYSPEIKGNLIIEFDMLIKSSNAQAGIMFNAGKGSPVKGHIGRATLKGKFFAIQRDKSKAVKKEKFKKAPVGKWFHLTFELVGDTVVAQFNKKKLIIKHEDFQRVNNMKMLLLAGKTVEYKNFKMYKAIPNK